MPLRVLTDAYDGLERAQNSGELAVEMEKFAKSMGFDKFAYALTINTASYKPQLYFISGYPPGWADRYVAGGYLKVDPIVRYVQSTTLPAIWDESMFHDGRAGEFWEEARAFGLSAGLSFSVREQAGVTGIFSLARDRTIDLEGENMAALVGRAQLFASMLHHAVCRIDLPKLLPETAVALTARERECLQWAAEGKTAWEIGQILGITERTSVFHLNNVVRKMGSTSKAQAIVRAVALRLI